MAASVVGAIVKFAFGHTLVNTPTQSDPPTNFLFSLESNSSKFVYARTRVTGWNEYKNYNAMIGKLFFRFFQSIRNSENILSVEDFRI